MALKYATLCSGIEGFGLGFDRAGMECVYQCEVDKTCRSVLERHWPGVERGTDVNDDAAEESLRRYRPDVLAFGFPCQDLSVAGLRAGLAGKRSGLFFRCAFLIAQCRPRWVCIENVPGLLSSNGGRDMGAVVGTLGELGYWWAYRVLDAQWFGVPQRRRRVFIVGCAGDRAGGAKVLFEREGVPWDSPPSREKGPRIASTLTSGVAGSRGVNAPGRRREDDVNIVAALTRNGVGTCGADDNQAQAGHLLAYGGGNCSGDLDVATCLTHHGNRQDFDTETFIAHTLRAEGFDASEDGTGRGTPLVPAYAFQERGREGGRNLEYQEDVAYSLMNPGNGGRRQENCVAFRPTGGTHSVEATEDCSPSLKVGSGIGIPSPPAVQMGMAVRRLTPRECERLQGFPDDWTRWAANGTEISDSGRYRMLGNAVAVPVAQWIGGRIVEAGL